MYANEAPTTKHQAPEKLQTSSSKERGRWNLVFGAWCFSGAWCLELGVSYAAFGVSRKA
jgi:hypothetical protein